MTMEAWKHGSMEAWIFYLSTQTLVQMGPLTG